MKEPQIRPARLSDVEAMAGLLDQLFQIERDFTPDRGTQIAGLKALLEGSATVLVLESEGRVQGMVTLQTLISTASGGPVGLIEDLVIDQALRGKGYGETLLEAVLARSKELGHLRVQLLADKSNPGALRFYGRLGFYALNLIALRYEE